MRAGVFVAWAWAWGYTHRLYRTAAKAAWNTGLRFELVDRVLERTAERIVTIKSVTSAEEYLADHFPDFPVLPGVMMLEAMVQAGRLLAAGPEGGADPRSCDTGQPLMLAQVRNVRYGNMVRPGQSLTVEVTVRGRTDDGSVDLQGTGSVDGQVAVQGRFTLAPMQA